MWMAGIVACFVAAALAWRCAAMHPRHRPIALFLFSQLAADVARRALALLNAPAYAAAAGAPLEGWARIRFHGDELLHLSWPAGLVATSALVFLDGPWRRRVAALAGLAGALGAVALALAYPAVRRDRLATVYALGDLVAVATVVALALPWIRRRLWPSIAELSILILLALELVALLRWSPFHLGWDWQARAYTTAYLVLAALFGGELLWKSLKKPRSS